MTVPVGVKSPVISMVPGLAPGENVPSPETFPMILPLPLSVPPASTTGFPASVPSTRNVPDVTAVAPATAMLLVSGSVFVPEPAMVRFP